MIESALHVLLETTFDCRIEAFVEIKVVSLLIAANIEAANC